MFYCKSKHYLRIRNLKLNLPVDTGHLMTKPDVVKTSGKRSLFYDVLKTSYLRHPEDVQLTTSWRHLIYDVLKTSDLHRLENAQLMSSWRRPIYNVLTKNIWFGTFWGRLIYDVLKTSNLCCLENVQFTTSSRSLWNIVCVAMLQWRLCSVKRNDFFLIFLTFLFF